MMRKCISLIFVLACLSLVSGGVVHAQGFDFQSSNIERLAGRWQIVTGDGFLEENWTMNEQGELEGISGFNNGEKTEPIEYLRIIQIGTHVVYIAAPINQKPALFQLTHYQAPGNPDTNYKAQGKTDTISEEKNKAVNSAEIGVESWKFENQEHDFPKVIFYEMIAEGKLKVTVSGTENGEAKEMSWNFKLGK